MSGGMPGDWGPPGLLRKCRKSPLIPLMQVKFAFCCQLRNPGGQNYYKGIKQVVDGCMMYIAVLYCV